MADPVRGQVEHLHKMGPMWLAQFLADLSEISGCEAELLALLQSYSSISAGLVRARR